VAGYVLEEQIGAGGMAVVFRARDERLGRPVALKVLAPHHPGRMAGRRRLERTMIWSRWVVLIHWRTRTGNH
jgi:serine/threonine protein kinase